MPRQIYIAKQQNDCISCHGDLIKNSVVHTELESNCDICHTSTGESHPNGKVKGFTLSEKLPELCFNCHTDFQEKMTAFPFVHGPMKDPVSCINCHNPHSSSEQRLLIIKPDEVCFICHSKTIRTDSSRISNIKQILTGAKSVHPPVESDGCIICHNPHFSENNKLLVAKFPSDQYVKAIPDNFELCFMCHDPKLIECQITKSATGFRNGTKNLHYVHVHGEKGRNCSICHDIHGALNDRLIVDKVKFGSWEMKIDFKITEVGGTCLTACHTEKTYDRTIPKQAVTKKAVNTKK